MVEPLQLSEEYILEALNFPCKVAPLQLKKTPSTPALLSNSDKEVIKLTTPSRVNSASCQKKNAEPVSVHKILLPQIRTPRSLAFQCVSYGKSTTKPQNDVIKKLQTKGITPGRRPPLGDTLNTQNKENVYCRAKMLPFGLSGKQEDLMKPQPLSPPRKHKYITVNGKSYIKVGELGTGGFSHVYECLDGETYKQAAIKCVDISQSGISQGFMDEVKMLRKLQVTNRVVKLYEYELCKETKMLYIVMEKGHSDLQSILRNSSYLPMYSVIFYWMEMLHCVDEIHKIGIIHSDLKPANFLLTNGNVLKLIDFGISCSLEPDKTSVLKHAVVGTLNYISPEAIADACPNETAHTPSFRITFKSDSWSLGCILYEMVYKELPFSQYKKMHLKIAAMQNPMNRISFPNIPREIPEYLTNAMRSCLQFDPSLRPTVAELITTGPD